ncbi:hypothetical protein IVB08_37210 [Bradyrhizobium sp. 173]|uniref:hypothetical protein n=1 Tax=Bradyrhizobium sp. 173 TaxID=2782644 RepID=UPI001FF703FB|nr:hypothetical protein [Bradyrhizobium sp. 173]MCK1569476.1 hypothetical protein [Bradyrhizobium sp. 173]
MTQSLKPQAFSHPKRRTSLIRRIDNLWVGIGLPHWLNENSVAPVELSAEAITGKKVLTIA